MFLVFLALKNNSFNKKIQVLKKLKIFPKITIKGTPINCSSIPTYQQYVYFG